MSGAKGRGVLTSTPIQESFGVEGPFRGLVASDVSG